MKIQKGFTLVEIAIVLVIIGLLLGGILKGQEMITQAKIKNVIADMSGVSAAMYGYQDRYRALPGDDKNAGDTGGRWGKSAPKGNGDGVITGTWTTGASEAGWFWDHLRRAGFVAGSSGTDNPFNAVSGRLGVQTGDGKSPPTGVLGEAANTRLFNSLMLCSGTLPDKIAISVDSQMDDGIGTTGSVRAKKGATSLTATEAADTYTEDGVSTYLVCRLM
jgi:prepilin-type N-terminal cleavage/methylation domain-containing protein